MVGDAEWLGRLTPQQREAWDRVLKQSNEYHDQLMWDTLIYGIGIVKLDMEVPDQTEERIREEGGSVPSGEEDSV